MKFKLTDTGKLPRCEDCIFYRTLKGDWGECMHDPPAYNSGGNRPTTKFNEYCREFTDKKELKKQCL